MAELDPLTEDALMELFNIGVSRAATSLSSLAKREVSITPPNIKYLSRNEMIDYAIEHIGGEVTAMGIEFEGNVDGHIQLLLARQQALPISKLMLMAQGLEINDKSILRESLLETSNILLNACLGSLANSLKVRFETQVPKLIPSIKKQDIAHDFDDDDFCLDWQFSEISLGVLLQMDLSIQIDDFNAKMMIYLELPSTTVFEERLSAFVKRLTS